MNLLLAKISLELDILSPNEEHSEHAHWKWAFPNYLFMKEGSPGQKRPLKNKKFNQHNFHLFHNQWQKVTGLDWRLVNPRCCHLSGFPMESNLNLYGLSCFNSNAHSVSYWSRQVSLSLNYIVCKKEITTLSKCYVSLNESCDKILWTELSTKQALSWWLLLLSSQRSEYIEKMKWPMKK